MKWRGTVEDKSATIYEIAALSGVSASTVSRVINGYPYVKKETREKILKILEEQNYIQNDTARSLVTKSAKLVGILIADLRTTHHTEGVYYILEELRKNGYTSIIYNTGTEMGSQAEYIRFLSRRRVDALVLMGSVYQNDGVLEAVKTYLASTPVMLCNGLLEGDNIYSILSDEKRGVRDAVKLLYDKGRRHFAFFLDHYTPSNSLKREGFREGLEYCGLRGIEIESGDGDDALRDATERFLSAHPETDAVIYVDDYTALFSMHVLIEHGISIPEDIAVMGLNNSRYASISNPALSSIDTKLHETSLLASENLLKILNGGEAGHVLTLRPVIVERATT